MGRFAKSFRELEVYQRALELVVDIHVFCDTLPSKEKPVKCNAGWTLRSSLPMFRKKFINSLTNVMSICWLSSLR